MVGQCDEQKLVPWCDACGVPCGRGQVELSEVPDGEVAAVVFGAVECDVLVGYRAGDEVVVWPAHELKHPLIGGVLVR